MLFKMQEGLFTLSHPDLFYLTVKTPKNLRFSGGGIVK